MWASLTTCTLPAPPAQLSHLDHHLSVQNYGGLFCSGGVLEWQANDYNPSACSEIIPARAADVLVDAGSRSRSRPRRRGGSSDVACESLETLFKTLLIVHCCVGMDTRSRTAATFELAPRRHSTVLQCIINLPPHSSIPSFIPTLSCPALPYPASASASAFTYTLSPLVLPIPLTQSLPVSRHFFLPRFGHRIQPLPTCLSASSSVEALLSLRLVCFRSSGRLCTVSSEPTRYR